MIKRLKIKFLSTIMFFVTVIIVALVAAIAVIPVQRDRQEAKSFLEMIVNEPAEIRTEPIKGLPQTPIPMQRPKPNLIKDDNRFMLSNLVTARIDSSGNLVSWFSDRQDLHDEEYIKSAFQKIISKNNEFGTVDGQYYMMSETDSGYYMALIDSGVAISNSQRTLVISVVAGVGAWILLLILAILLVNRMIKPVREAFEKQKQFVSDAGHELKTPLSVISANSNVLENEIGENKWLSYIKNETERMDSLVKNLMILAKMDDTSKATKHCEFDMSKAVLSAGLPFESLAFEKKMVIQFEVQPDIRFCGSEEQTEQLAAILLSNAIKYGSEAGVIRLSLTKERKKITLSVYNTGQGISQEEKEKIFDRFYRADKARSRLGGGYGLGLAIAKAIVDEHNGKIMVESESGKWIRFDIVFNQR